jgi:hypothetical protein
MNTLLSRRYFLQLLAASAATPLTGCSHSTTSSRAGEHWITAQGKHSAQFGLGDIQSAATAHNFATGFRGHGVCSNPVATHKVVMTSRRPGLTAVEVDLLSGEQKTFDSPPGFHMQGHSVYSADGQFLLTAESEYASGEGKIVVRDSSRFAVTDIMPSYGIGPHEIKLMPDGHTLVIANGGLLTHPESGRTVLNLDNMDSSLTYIDTRSGDLVAQHRVDEPKASIRHLDVAADGSVAFAMQIQRQAMNNNQLVPLAGVHKPGNDIRLLNAPEGLLNALNDYMGSVVVDSATRLAAFTSPRGDMAVFWHLDDLSLQGYHKFHDVCGLALNSTASHFVLSNSVGKIRQIETRTLKEDRQRRLHFPHMAWDNHMLSVSLNS